MNLSIKVLKVTMKSLSIFTLALVVTSFASAEDNSAKRAIEARYAEMSKAFAAKDASGFESVFAPNFTAKGPGGQITTRARLLNDFEGQMRALNNVKWTQKITKIKVEGKVAHVVINSTMTAQMDGAKGSKHTFKLESTDNKSDWVKTTKGWQVTYSEVHGLKMWMDGKPLKQG